MMMSRLRSIGVFVFLLAIAGIAYAQDPATTIAVTGQGAQTEVALSWAADGGVFYDILSSTI